MSFARSRSFRSLVCFPLCSILVWMCGCGDDSTAGPKAKPDPAVDCDSALCVRVIDQVDVRAIAQALVQVDLNHDGRDDMAMGATDSNGRVATTTAVSNPYTLTVFHADYHPLSVVGLPADYQLVTVKLRRKYPVPSLAGFTGRADFDAYEQIVLGGNTKTVRLGFAAASFPFAQLVREHGTQLFSLDSGVNCQLAPPPPGCYDFVIPNLIDTTIALPGNVVMGLGSAAIKTHVDVLANPGPRWATMLAGEAGLAEFADLGQWLGYQDGECACNTLEGTCEGDCSCDEDCQSALEVSAAMVPMLAGFALATHPDLVLEAAPVSSWEDYIADAYGDRPTSSEFPRLDTGQLGKLAPIAPMSVFSDIRLPQLPTDPAFDDGRKLAGVMVSTGVLTAAGFVTTGLTAAVDCTEGNCTDRSGGQDAGVFDGIVNGGNVCTFDSDPVINTCPAEVPETVADGHVGWFHAAPPSEAGDRWATVVMALPRRTQEEGHRATAFVSYHEPSGSLNMTGRAFPPFPNLPTTISDRSYTPTSAAGHDYNWVTLASQPNGDGVVTEWDVLFAGNQSFIAPMVPAGVSDPLAAATVDVRHVAIDWPTAAHLTGNIEAKAATVDLSNCIFGADGFAVREATLAIE